jgi:hypothetical protein
MPLPLYENRSLDSRADKAHPAPSARPLAPRERSELNITLRLTLPYDPYATGSPLPGALAERRIGYDVASVSVGLGRRGEAQGQARGRLTVHRSAHMASNDVPINSSALLRRSCAS